MIELWEEEGASVEFSSLGLKEDSGIRDTVSWLELILISMLIETLDMYSADW